MGRDPAKRFIVLLAEDDCGDQELTRRALESHPHSIDLRIVCDGEEALDYLLRRGQYASPDDSPKPNLVLLDLNMPRVDGRQVLEQMRCNTDLKCIPVVVLTTSQQEEDIIRSYQLGCNSFITKPLDLVAFENYIRELGDYWFDLVSIPAD